MRRPSPYALGNAKLELAAVAADGSVAPGPFRQFEHDGPSTIDGDPTVDPIIQQKDIPGDARALNGLRCWNVSRVNAVGGERGLAGECRTNLHADLQEDRRFHDDPETRPGERDRYRQPGFRPLEFQLAAAAAPARWHQGLVRSETRRQVGAGAEWNWALSNQWLFEYSLDGGDPTSTCGREVWTHVPMPISSANAGSSLWSARVPRSAFLATRSLGDQRRRRGRLAAAGDRQPGPGGAQ